MVALLAYETEAKVRPGQNRRMTFMYRCDAPPIPHSYGTTIASAGGRGVSGMSLSFAG